MNNRNAASKTDPLGPRRWVLWICAEREQGLPRAAVIQRLGEYPARLVLDNLQPALGEDLLQELIANGDITTTAEGLLLTDRNKHPAEWQSRKSVREANRLLGNARQRLPELRELLTEVSSHWGYEDVVYRYYHHSFKVARAADSVRQIVRVLQSLAPHLALNSDFIQIVEEGAGLRSTWEQTGTSPAGSGVDPEKPPADPRRAIEAFFHARHMLEMLCKYVAELEYSPSTLPSGYATVLYLYNLR